jgi:hypothetical protein
VAAVHFRVETLGTRADAQRLAGEMAALLKLTDQACAAIDAVLKIVSPPPHATPAEL